MAFPPENLKIWVNSREIRAFIQTATYPPFTKGTMATYGGLVVPLGTDRDLCRPMGTLGDLL